MIINNIRGQERLVEKLDALFNKNPDDIKDAKDKDFLFNQLLTNGKNILHIACQEGKIDVVKYLISKMMNPLIKTKVIS